jgi:hypothetical protein
MKAVKIKQARCNVVESGIIVAAEEIFSNGLT